MEKKLSRSELLKKIAAANFMVVELNLYLNTHPKDCEAVDKFNHFAKEAREYKKLYEKYYGMITVPDSHSKCPWNWINEPWPWEAEANFRL
jgi:spore coat protein JB